MEEDIKLMKEWVERDRDIRHNDIKGDFDEFCERHCIAIENILNRLEQDERVIEEMAECINNLGWSDLDNNKDIIEHFRKRVESNECNRKI